MKRETVTLKNEATVLYLVESIAVINEKLTMSTSLEIIELFEKNSWVAYPEQAGVHVFSLKNGNGEIAGRVLVEDPKGRTDLVQVMKRIERGLFLEILFYAGGKAICSIYPKFREKSYDGLGQIFEKFNVTLGAVSHEQALLFIKRIDQYQKAN